MIKLVLRNQSLTRESEKGMYNDKLCIYKDFE